MTVYQHLDAWKQVAARAYASGAEVLNPGGPGHGITRLRWDVAGRCKSPVYREYLGSEPERVSDARMAMFALGYGDVRVYRREHDRKVYRRGPPHVIELNVRCRRCEDCLAARARLWRMRAQAEIQSSARTWFGTLTLSPSEHFKVLSALRLRMAESGADFDTLDEADQFRARVRAIGAEITRWLKRVRKESGAKLRYCLVVERHKSGLPHWHVLIHEVEGSVRERTLRKQWHLGFSMFKLVAQDEKQRAANYVAKYLSKSLLSKVRASKAYGTTNHNELNASVHRLTDQGNREKSSLTPPTDDAMSKGGGLYNVSKCMADQPSPQRSGAVPARLSRPGTDSKAGERQHKVAGTGERQFGGATLEAHERWLWSEQQGQASYAPAPKPSGCQTIRYSNGHRAGP